MLNFSEYRALMARTDYGYGLLILSVLLVLLVGWCLWRFERGRGAMKLVAFGAYSLTLIAFSPVAAGVAGVVLVLSRFMARFRLRYDRFPVWVSLAVGLTLRLPRLFDDLWYDETFTAAIARLPFDRLRDVILADVHPPTGYVIQWLFARVFGTSEIALRLPALIFGLLLIWLVYRLASSLHLYGISFVASLIVAVLPAALYYSAEARQYTLLACFVFGFVIAVLESRWHWVIACGMFMAWTHSLGLVYLGVLGLGALVLYPSRRLLGSLMVAGLGAAAWLPFMLAQSGDVVNGFWLPPLTFAGVFWPVVDMTLTLRLEEPYILHSYIPIIGLTLVAFIWSWRWWLTTRAGAFLAVLIIGVPLVVALAAAFWQPIYLTRALLPCALALVFAWCRVLVYAPDRALARLFFVPALVVALVGFFAPGAARTPLKSYLDTCRGADGVLVMNTSAQFLASYYLPDMPLFLYVNSDDLNQTLPASAKRAFGFRQTGSITQIGRDVCVILWDSPMTTSLQRVVVAGLLDVYPYTSREIEASQIYHLNLYRLSIEENSYAYAKLPL